MFKLIKLVTGDLIFGWVAKKYSDMSLLVVDPRQVIIDKDGIIYLIPYNPLSSDSQELFSSYSIVSESSAGEGIINLYNQTLETVKSKDSTQH